MDLWPKFHSKQRFQDRPIGNSDSHTGLTSNPINGVPSARLQRKLQIRAAAEKTMELRPTVITVGTFGERLGTNSKTIISRYKKMRMGMAK